MQPRAIFNVIVVCPKAAAPGARLDSLFWHLGHWPTASRGHMSSPDCNSNGAFFQPVHSPALELLIHARLARIGDPKGESGCQWSSRKRSGSDRLERGTDIWSRRPIISRRWGVGFRSCAEPGTLLWEDWGPNQAQCIEVRVQVWWGVLWWGPKIFCHLGQNLRVAPNQRPPPPPRWCALVPLNGWRTIHIKDGPGTARQLMLCPLTSASS